MKFFNKFSNLFQNISKIFKKLPLKKLPLKWVIIVSITAVTILILSIGGFFAWKYFMGNDSDDTENKVSVNTISPDLIPKQSPFIDTIFSMDLITAQLKSTEGKKSLNVKIELEFENDQVREELILNYDKIQEKILNILQDQKPYDIQNIDSKFILKNKMIKILNKILKNGRIKNLYFSEFFINDTPSLDEEIQ